MYELLHYKCMAARSTEVLNVHIVRYLDGVVGIEPFTTPRTGRLIGRLPVYDLSFTVLSCVFVIVHLFHLCFAGFTF